MSLLKSGIITSTFTFASRILGLIRDIFIANLLGAGLSADVFFFANRIPNFFRRLFAEGAFSQAFVPVMTEFKENKDREDLEKLISSTVGTLACVVFLITILGMIGSAVITAIFGWGWFVEHISLDVAQQETSKFSQASFLLKLTFPYLFFITLTAVSGGILNTFGRFAIPAVTPCLLNLSMIASCVWIAPLCSDANLALGIGVLLGGIVQFLFQLPFLYKIGMIVKPKFAWNHEGVKKIRSLMIPALFGVSVSQINLLINTMLASFLATGAISYLYYSDRLLEFPIGIFAVAIGTIILPKLSMHNAKKEYGEYSLTMNWAVKMVLALGIPAMCGMIMLREPIIRVLFLRGEFGVDQATFCSYSLIASALGVWSLMLNRVLVQGFYARFDTRTPVKYGVYSMISNMFFCLSIVIPLEYYYPGYGYIGLALSTGLSAIVNTLCLIIGLYKKDIYRFSKATIFFVVKTVISSIVMCYTLHYLCIDVLNVASMQSWSQLNIIQSVIYLFSLVFVGSFSYVVVMLLTRALKFNKNLVD